MNEAPIPTLVGLSELVDLFPVTKATVYRWNTESGGRRRALPPPAMVVSGSSLWRLDTILVWAARRGLRPNLVVVAQLRAAQRQRG